MSRRHRDSKKVRAVIALIEKVKPQERTHPERMGLEKCLAKKSFVDKRTAQSRATSAAKRGKFLWPYRCKHCFLWHLTSTPPEANVPESPDSSEAR